MANSWRTQRWDALRLLTPNWLSCLPGFAYDGDDPDGFMTMPEVIGFIDRYSSVIDAPVRTGTTVTDVRSVEGGYRVTTDDGVWEAPTVMLASGGFNLPHVPDVAADVPDSVEVISPLDYRRPDQLPAGRVLVVGASATGIQTRGRDPSVGTAGHALRRRARAHAARLSGTRRHVVDVDGGRLGRALRRDRRPRARPQHPFAPARGNARPRHARPERPHQPGRRTGGPAGRDPGRRCPLLGIAAQRLLARGPQTGAAARPLRRVGPRQRRRWRGRAPAPPRADAPRRRAAAHARSPLGGDRNDRVGDRASDPTTRGCRCPCSTAKGGCVTTAAW